MTASPHSPPPDLAETRRRLQEQRRRLERIAQRYQQLEQALESLEGLMDQYAPQSDSSDEPPDAAPPRKPR